MQFILDFDVRAGEGSKSSKKLREYTNNIKTNNEEFFKLLNEADQLCSNLREKQPILVQKFSDITGAIILKKAKNNPVKIRNDDDFGS